ncbi:MAG TPA: hypothetical protein VM076_21880, partial [Gemmatimonadaceae bacterium]|nr:hypothetical protein [Gemmatimonadaceae bacterium]
ELAIHFIGTTMMGAAFATYLLAGWPTRDAPSELVRWAAGTFPPWLPTMAWGAVAFGIVLVGVEGGLAVRYRRA